MKIKKISILTVIVLILCGCEKNTNWNTDDYSIGVYTDGKTCVEYLKYASGYKGGLSVRYNSDGTIKLNKECLEDKK